MPTTIYNLTILVLSALVGLSGCNGTLPSRSANDTKFPTSNSRESSEAAAAKHFWLQDPFLMGDAGAAQIEQTWIQDPFMTDSEPSSEINTLADIDVWTRIRLGFEMTPSKNSRIKRQLEWYHDHPEHLPQIEERARPYLYYIVESLDRRDLPMELALLPVIESAFKPSAYSSQNAAGIWQFMPSTGKMLGLEQNWWYDGRLDVVAATEAALDYLQYLANQFDGDWELALAAYNSGEGTVRRAIQKNQKLGKPTDYWSLDLPRETERYVPHLLALAKVVEKPEAFGIQLSKIPNQPFFASVDIGAQLDLRLAAEMADLPLNELYQLNPGFHRSATAPQGPHRLILPLDNIEQFQEKLAELDPDKRVRLTRYTIQPGDNLGGIANRHGTTVAALKQTNKLKSNRIRAGKHLLIPEPAHFANRPATIARQKQSPVKPAGNKTTYTIRSGDSLWAIAENHKVNHRTLAQWNGITLQDTLRPGQKLVVFNAATNSTKNVTSLSYSVRKGDSLSSIADRFNVTVSNIRKWNHLPSKYLQPGQKLNLRPNLAEQSI